MGFTGAGVEIIEAAGGSDYMVGKTGVGVRRANAVGNEARLLFGKKAGKCESAWRGGYKGEMKTRSDIDTCI